jgi:hypothetical protein
MMKAIRISAPVGVEGLDTLAAKSGGGIPGRIILQPYQV